MKVTRESTYTITLNEAEAAKQVQTLTLVMEALLNVPRADYSRLVSTGAVDQLLALRTALQQAET